MRDRLQEQLVSDPHPSAQGIKIISSTDPQLVVVKGLLFDRLQKLESGTKSVLVTRKARASYGLMCKMKYNPEIHFQEELKTDPLDGQAYAMSQIDWLIKKVRGYFDFGSTIKLTNRARATILTRMNR